VRIKMTQDRVQKRVLRIQMEYDMVQWRALRIQMALRYGLVACL